jgi:hypothetical protein
MMKAALSLVYLLLLFGCTGQTPPEPTRTPPPQSVLEASIEGYLKLLDSADYHSLRQVGATIFLKDFTIPNHRALFEGYDFAELPDGQIRYDLFTVEGDAGSAWIRLYLEQDTGKIVEFSAGEASR